MQHRFPYWHMIFQGFNSSLLQNVFSICSLLPDTFRVWIVPPSSYEFANDVFGPY